MHLFFVYIIYCDHMLAHSGPFDWFTHVFKSCVIGPAHTGNCFRVMYPTLELLDHTYDDSLWYEHGIFDIDFSVIVLLIT